MSWAAHDPEGWDKVEAAAVGAKLRKAIEEAGFEVDTQVSEAVGIVIEVIQQRQISDAAKLWSELTFWALAEHGNAEADYLTRGIA